MKHEPPGWLIYVVFCAVVCVAVLMAFWSAWMARFAEMAKAHEDQMRVLDRNAAAWWAEQQRRAA